MRKKQASACRQLANLCNEHIEKKHVKTPIAIYDATLAELDQRRQEGIQHGNL